MVAIQKSPSFKDYRAFFKEATISETAPNGFDPFPYQERLSSGELPQIPNIPTGAGKRFRKESQRLGEKRVRIFYLTIEKINNATAVENNLVKLNSTGLLRPIRSVKGGHWGVSNA